MFLGQQTNQDRLAERPEDVLVVGHLPHHHHHVSDSVLLRSRVNIKSQTSEAVNSRPRDSHGTADVRSLTQEIPRERLEMPLHGIRELTSAG